MYIHGLSRLQRSLVPSRFNTLMSTRLLTSFPPPRKTDVTKWSPENVLESMKNIPGRVLSRILKLRFRFNPLIRTRSFTTIPPRKIYVTKWDTPKVLEWVKTLPGVLEEDAEKLNKQRLTGSTLLTLNNDELEKCGIPLGPRKQILLEIEKLTDKLEANLKRKTDFLDDEYLFVRPRVTINGMPLSKRAHDFVLESVDAKLIKDKILEDIPIRSKAYYLAGSYATGKTNTLSQLRYLMIEEGFLTLWINADHRVGNKKWSLIEEELMKIPFVKLYVESCKKKDLEDKNDKRDETDLLTLCTEAFDNEKNRDVTYEKILICIDDGETIKDGIIILQGKPSSEHFFDLSPHIQEMTNDIYEQTNGHPGLSAHYFATVRDLLNRIQTGQYNIDFKNFLKEWKKEISWKIHKQIEESRLKTRMTEQLTPELIQNIEHSGLLYKSAVFYQKDQQWQLITLRLGIAKMDSEQKNIVLSCRIMEQFYLQSISPPVPPTDYIEKLCKSSGVINSELLLKKLFLHLNIDNILNKEQWVTTRFDPKLTGPSEKQYQSQFYSILFSMCSSSIWHPLFESKAGNQGKVDLGIQYSPTNHKYMIELATNSRNTGESHSAEGHYKRQVEQYQQKDTNQSIVIIIYNYKRPNYFWPKTIVNKVLCGCRTLVRFSL